MYDTYWPINPFTEEPSHVPILREAFPDWKLNKGIFDRLADLYEVPWADSAESSVLNYEYFGNHSGGKFVAPVVLNVLGDNESLSDIDRDVLASIIWSKFKEPWTRLWATNVIEYNPIHNYDMTEERGLVRGDSSTEVSAGNSNDETTHGKTVDTDEYIYGYNSTDESPSDKTSVAEGGTTSLESDFATSKDAASAREERETSERSGNIGVTTTQAMLASERELWKWNFFDQVYKDIDSVLSISFYDPCRV